MGLISPWKSGVYAKYLLPIEVHTFENPNTIATMYEPVKFKRLQELASELQNKLQALSGGNLSATELENMTEHSRELYERLIVLRFKAFADEVSESNPVSEEVVVKEEIAAAPPIAFKIDEPRMDVAPNQVSLIDAIEEVTKEEKLEEIIKEEKLEEVIEEIVSEVQPEPVQMRELRELQPPKSAQQVVAGGYPESLNDQLVRGMGVKETLADRLEHNSIPDLKKAITLNQRFQFSRELFKGNNQEYEVAVEKLNSIGREDAMRHLDSLKNKYAWNNESSIASDFINLVERRHQH